MAANTSRESLIDCLVSICDMNYDKKYEKFMENEININIHLKLSMQSNKDNS